MNNTDVPIWEKYTLSIEEAGQISASDCGVEI